MFPKLHHLQPQSLPFSNPFQIPARECHHPEDEEEEEEEEEEEVSPVCRTPSRKTSEPSSGDCATIEVVKRPRGRPPGSKNKPKTGVVAARDPEPSMSPYILEVPGGSDVVEAIARFCRRKNMGLCVLTGSGTVSNVTLQQPSATPGATVTFHGRFHIISISATFLPHSTAVPVPNGFAVYLAGPQGQVVGGLVSGNLIAAGSVFVIASSFDNPSYHRLSDEDETRNSDATGGGEKNSPVVSGARDSVTGSLPPPETVGMPTYSCHVPSDVIWAPTARAPPHPPPY